MKIIDVRKFNNEILAVCHGEDLPLKTDCKSLLVGKKILSIKKYGSSISLTGNRTALISFNNVSNVSDIPLSDFVLK